MAGTAVAHGVRVTSMFYRTAVLVLCLGACGRIPGIAEVRRDCSNLACRPTTTVSWTGATGIWPLDILIVVDDSVPAGPAQGALSQAVRGVAEYISQQLQDDVWAMDIHVAVVPANLAPNSTPRLWPKSQACPQPDGDYLQANETCGGGPNFTGPLADLLDCATTHLDRSGQPSRPMETLRALLTPGGLGETTGFRRPSAWLALGIVSATDDPDLATEAGRADYRNVLLGAVPDADALELTVVAPADAQGLRRFVDLVGTHPGYEDMADTSWPKLAWLGKQPLEHNMANLCIYRPFVDLAAPGSPMRPLCFVIEHDTSPDGATAERTLPMCEASGTPDAHCWRAVINREKCPAGPQIHIPIVRPGCRTPDRIKYQMTCAVEYQQVASSDLHPGNCGTADEPATLIVTHRTPALGATVKNSNITEGFTVEHASMFRYDIELTQTSPLHTAGSAIPVDLTGSHTLNGPWSDDGTPGRFQLTVDSWSEGPGHVELSAVAGYHTDDGCYYQLPSPLFSYDVTP